MVRPHFGPPRLKPRPYRDDGMGSSSDSNYRSRRDDHDFHGKPPPLHWKDSRGRGRPQMVKRVSSVGEPREPRFNNWRSTNEDSYHSYPSKTEPHHQRRPSPSRPNRSPHNQHHPRSPAHRGPPFHSHPPPGHRSPSPRHFHSHPEDRRPGPPPPFRGSFRGKRHPGFSHPEQRSREPPMNYSPRDRPYEPSHMRRWNGAGAFSHNDKGPREFHGRGPERWAEQDPGRQRGPMERQHSRSHSRERAQDTHSHPPPFRPPSWKGSSPHSPPHERHMPVPRKRRISDVHPHPSDHAMGHDDAKHPRRERPQLMNMPRPLAPRPFGPRPFGPRPFGTRPFGPRPFGARPFGRPLSLRDRSFLIKSRQMRAESLMKLRLPPSFKARASFSSVLALRKKRFESGAAPLRKPEQRETRPKQSPTKTEGNASQSSDSKEQVESRRSVNSHRSSPPKKDDLVVLSHWESGAGSSSKDHSPSRDHNPKTERHSGPESTSTSRNDKPHFTRSFEDRNRGYSDCRPDKPDGFFRRPFPAGPRRPGPPMDRFQRPAFRKSLSIVSKYRNMRVMRQRGSYSRGPDQRW
ncbi:serine/arginine repetitive matrix protein 1 [Boleophthalmus pectinirostris]|uniref:serine/arginine repetitive matrix protein 1 n=1 Tax=Boleophthalmus pectinirostris TaxID=150288 RepID=UPI000A1C25F4|nr:serine/arginine repetitive matrix protein 1 [Boleophthalmus pectinirostris]